MKKINLMKGAAAAALFSLVALLGCNNNAAGAGNYSATGQIFGYVTDTKGEPLSGVTIALGNQTTTTNANGAFALTGVPANATQNANGGITEATTTNTAGQKYVLTATKDGYLSSKMEDIYVVETTDKSDAALLLNTAATAYKDILWKFAEQGGAGITTVSSNVATDGILMNTQNINETFKGMADAYATIIEKYQNLSKTYESTFVTTTLTPCNGWFEGTLKITKSPAKNITTDASSIKAAPEGVKVKLAGGSGTTKYIYEATTDKDGNFKFEKLPVNTELKIMVEGFIGTYESGDGENKVTEKYYYSLPDSSAATTAQFTYSGVELPEDKLTINLDENSGAKFNATILLYSEPEKIIVTDTNLLQNTVVAPLALNTPVTVTFNKPMDYVTLGDGTTVSDSGDKATYAWDEKKTTVTITPKDGYWTASTTTATTATFALAGRAQDGATSFIDNSFTVTLDNVIKTTFKDTSDASVDSFTLTFDRELVNTAAVKVTDSVTTESVITTWDLTTTPAAPVLTVKARDGKFATAGEHTFTITGVEAKDQSTKLYSYNREFDAASAGATPPAYKFKTRFDGFKATGVEVVNKAEGDLSRAVVATTAQYLKITFNKNLGDVSGLTVKDGTANTANTVNVKKFVKDNAVYISLAEFKDNNDIVVSGKVYSTSGDEFDGDATTAEVRWTDLLAGYKVRTAYVIAASNLYTVKDSINAGNDNTVNKIKKGDTVTLTFNKEIPTGAVITTELYDTLSENLDETALKATAVSAGKVVTVTLDSKVKINTTYYLSLKIKSADGAELFSTGSSSFGTGNVVKDLYIEPAITHTVTSGTNNGKKYIKIEVDTIKLLTTSSSKTTKAAEFNKTSQSNVVLQFNQNVTGYKAYLYDSTYYNTLKTKTLVDLAVTDKAKFYTSTFEVVGDTITIKPTYSFKSNKTIGVAVFDDEGKFVELKKDANGADIAYTLTTKSYATKLDPDNALKAITNFKAKEAKLDNGTYPEFTFDMLQLNKYNNTSVPSFYLYKKVNSGYDAEDAIEWQLIGTSAETVNPDGKTTVYNYTNYKIDKFTAYIKASETVNLTYANTETFILLAVQDDMVVKSEEVVITKK